MRYPISPRNTANSDALAYWEGFLTNEDIELLLNRLEWGEVEEGQVYTEDGGVEKNLVVRSSKLAWLEPEPELLLIWDKLANVVAEVNRTFFHFDLTGFYEPIQLGLYTSEDNGHYDWHVDGNNKDAGVPRKLSMSLLLSDPSEFEGGEFQVKAVTDEPRTMEFVKGRAWFFPSYMLHRVAPVTKGVRKSLVLWVGGPPFK